MAYSPSHLVQQAIADPNPGQRLRAIVDLRDELAELELDAVHSAVESGASWAEVAEALGVSKQSAHKRFARALDGRRPRRRAQAEAPHIVITARARHAVRAARAAARVLGHDEADTAHMLLGLLADDTCPAAQALEAIGVRLESAQRVLADLHPPGAERRPRPVPISAEAREALEQALLEALRLGHAHLGGEHILLGIVRGDSTTAAGVLDALGVEPDDVERCLGKVLLEASFDAR